jgi:hypothetical protein
MRTLIPCSLDDQINCVQREIRMREQTYPRWVEAKRMAARKADDELQCMRAVLATLLRVRSSMPLRPESESSLGDV